MTTQTSTKPTADAEVEPDLDIPVLVGLAEMVRLVPRKPQTVYRWRMGRNGHPPALPKPFAILSRSPVWRLDTFLSVAIEKGIEIDEDVLAEIRKGQGR